MFRSWRPVREKMGNAWSSIFHSTFDALQALLHRQETFCGKLVCSTSLSAESNPAVTLLAMPCSPVDIDQGWNSKSLLVSLICTLASISTPWWPVAWSTQGPLLNTEVLWRRDRELCLLPRKNFCRKNVYCNLFVNQQRAGLPTSNCTCPEHLDEKWFRLQYTFYMQCMPQIWG